jgi:hypothetical protein
LLRAISADAADHQLDVRVDVMSSGIADIRPDTGVKSRAVRGVCRQPWLVSPTRLRTASALWKGKMTC